MELNFKLWFEAAGTETGGKLALYPPLYTQYMNYPPQDVVTWSADAITYMNPMDVDPPGQKVFNGKFHPYFWFDKVNSVLISGK